MRPDFIAVDAGTTDVGPYYMGAGKAFFHPMTVRSDLRTLLAAARSLDVPLIIGNSMTAGTDSLIRQGVSLLHDTAVDLGLDLTVAIVHAEQRKADVKARLHDGRINSLSAPSPLTADDIDRAAVIVAQMGLEPIMAAVETGAQVILTGRACDDALFSAIPVMHGFDRGLALHMGKILECGSMACVPGDLHGSLLGHLFENHFVLEPPDPNRVCTVQSVASHALYERSHPTYQAGPGGANDLSACRFEQVGERTVGVWGSAWIRDDAYRIKLEGVSLVGYRSICMTGVRDPILIEQLPGVLARAEEDTARHFVGETGGFRAIFRQYGRNAVMGTMEPEFDVLPHEVGLLLEVVAHSQELADAVCTYLRGTVQHAYYPGIVATAGNLAYPFSPFVVSCGPVYRFTIDHLMEVNDPLECFPITIERVGVA